MLCTIKLHRKILFYKNKSFRFSEFSKFSEFCLKIILWGHVHHHVVVNYLVIQHFVKPFGACSRVNSFITAVNDVWLKLNIPRWKSNQFCWIDKQSISSNTSTKASHWSSNQIVVISPSDSSCRKAVEEHEES